MMASKSGSPEVMEVLLKGGADTGTSDHKGQTAMLHALKNGKVQAVMN